VTDLWARGLYVLLSNNRANKDETRWSPEADMAHWGEWLWSLDIKSLKMIEDLNDKIQEPTIPVNFIAEPTRQ